MVPLFGQMISFGITIAGGVLMGACFDVYRVLRSRLTPGPVATHLGDLFYWVVVTGLVFLLLMVANRGEFRLYVLLGFLLGGAGYYRFLSPKLLQVLVQATRYLGRWQRAVVYSWRRLLRWWRGVARWFRQVGGIFWSM